MGNKWLHLNGFYASHQLLRRKEISFSSLCDDELRRPRKGSPQEEVSTEKTLVDGEGGLEACA